MKLAPWLVSMLSLLPLAAASAASLNMRAGLWEVTSSTDMAAIPGMPKGMKIPAVVFKHCYTPADIESNKALMEKGDCSLVSMRQQGATASWVTECRGKEAMRMTGEGTFSGDKYQVKSRMTFLSGQRKGQSMASTINARRLGDCKK
jgi:hypothetical protein